METFEEYTKKIPTNDNMQSIIIVINNLGLSKSMKYFRSKIKRYKNIRDAYDAIVSSSVQNYYCYKLHKDKFKEDVHDLDILMHGIYEIDTQSGISEKLDRNLSKQEEEKILEKLDKDRDKFKNILKKYLNLLNNIEIKKLYIYFGKLIFTFNDYQAPYRTDPKKAIEDSMGMTNLYGELLDEIKNDN
jgi:hypothetical protein